MKRTIYITLFLAAVLSMQAQAQSTVNVEEELKRAQAALEEAARKIAELHTQKHSGMHGESGKRAMLGILIGEKVDGGVDIHGITPKSGAAEAGLEAGDKIVVIDGIDLSVMDDPYGTLSKHMKTVSPGDDVAITYLRGDKRSDTVVTTQARSTHVWKMIDGMDFDFDFDFDFDHDMQGIQTFKEMTSSSRSLMFVEGDLADYFDVDQGVVVIAPADESELKAGDVLLNIADEEIDSVATAIELNKRADEPQEARIKRKRRVRDVTLEPGELKGGVHQEVKVIRIEDKD